MEFKQTSLPDRQMFREAFAAGWAVYAAQFAGTSAVQNYMQGPVAMARLIFEHGGETRQVAAAACLAGPALFSETPCGWLSARLTAFAKEVRGVGGLSAAALAGKIPTLSADARLLLQASSILLLEQLAKARPEQPQLLSKTYAEALELYSLARGTGDLYKLDTRFEIAAMKVTTFMEGEAHLWAKPLVMPKSKSFNQGTRG